MRTLKPAFVPLLATLWSNAPMAAPGLLELYHDAMAYDAIYASARAELEAGKEALPQGLALLLPDIRGTGQTGFSHVELSGIDTARTLRDSPTRFFHNRYDTVSVTLTQPVFRLQNWASYLQSDTRYAFSVAKFAAAEQDLILRTAKAYFDVLQSQDAVEFAQAQKAAIGEQRQQAEALYKAGVGTITDVQEAMARHDVVSAREFEAINSMEVARRALERLVGARPEQIKPYKEVPLGIPEPTDMQTWIDSSESNNPQIQMAKSGVDFSGYQVDINRAAHLPTVDLVGSYSHAFTPSYFLPGDQNTSAYYLQFTVPIFQGGATQSKVREAVSNENKAKEDLLDTVRKSALAVSQSFLGITNGIAKVKALQQAVTSSELALQSTKMEHEAGVRTNVDVLDAQQQLYNTKLELAKARYTYIQDRLNLKAAVGMLSEEEVTLVDSWATSAN